MKYLKKYTDFFEDGTACASASTSAGMGAVSSAQPGAVAGTTGTTGSGDISFTFKKEKRKKGNPSQVSDMRDLAPAKNITKVEDIKESALTKDEIKTRQECLQELFDLGFVITMSELDSQDEEYDIDDDHYGSFKSQELRIALYKQIKKTWRGNLNIRCLFNKDEIHTKRISTLRGTNLESDESEILEAAEDASIKLINHLDFISGQLDIQFSVAGSAMPWNEERYVSVNIHIVLGRNIYPVSESYSDIDEYVNDIKSMLSKYNIRPLVLNQIINQNEDIIQQNFDEGKYPKFFVDEIVQDFELDSGGFLSYKLGSKAYNQSIKYL